MQMRISRFILASKPSIFFSIVTWTSVTEWVYLMTHYHHTFTGLNLSPGRTYRSSVKFCARLLCFIPVNSDGVTILASNPVTGNLTVNHQDSVTEAVYYQRPLDCWFFLLSAVILLKYFRYGLKNCPINQAINQSTLYLLFIFFSLKDIHWVRPVLRPRYCVTNW